MTQRDEVYARLIRLLAVRSHSEAELKRKLGARKFAQEQIGAAIERARLEGYVNDGRFASEFALYGRDRKAWAPGRTRQELKQRGVADDLIEVTIREVFADLDLREQALQLAKARARRMSGDTESNRRRLAGFLARRGYSVSVCRDVVDEVAPLQ